MPFADSDVVLDQSPKAIPDSEVIQDTIKDSDVTIDKGIPDSSVTDVKPGWWQDKFARFAAGVGKTMSATNETVDRLMAPTGLLTDEQNQQISQVDKGNLSGFGNIEQGQQPLSSSGVLPDISANPELNKTFGAQAAQTAGELAPSLILTRGGIGAITALNTSAAYSEAKDAALTSGKSEDEANEEGLKSAGFSAITLPAYLGIGKIAAKLTAPLVQTLNPFARFAASTAAATGANVTTSAALRAIQGEDATPDAVSLTQDILFAGMHGFGEATRPGQVERAQAAKDNIETQYDAGAKAVQDGSMSQDDYDSFVTQTKGTWNGLNDFLNKPENQKILAMQQEAQPEISVAQEVGPATAQATSEIKSNEQEQEVGKVDESQAFETPSEGTEVSGEETTPEGLTDMGGGGLSPDNIQGLGNATQKEFEITRTINGGDIFNGLKQSLGHEPTQEEWQPEFEKAHPELDQEQYDSLYQNSKTASAAYDQGNGNKPMPEVVNQLLQPESTENRQIASDQEAGTAQTLSTKNATTDQRREEIGLTPAEQVVRKTDKTTWDNASRKIQEQPQYQDNLIRELSLKPRVISDEDNAILLHRVASLENQRNAAVKAINDAHDSLNHELLVENRAKLAGLEDDLQHVYDVLKSSGTESGRALRARQIMVQSDYSLTNMVARYRATKSEGKITDSERKNIQELHDKIAAKDKQIQDLLNKSESRNRENQAKDTFSEIEKQGKATKSQRTDSQKLTDKIESKFKETGKATDLSSYVQRLALNFVREGMRGRDNVVNAVHDELQKIVPDIEKRQTEDLISGYGEFKQLDKEEAKTELRKYKGELQQIAKIEDLQKGIAPKKTGIERREVGLEESKLIKAVNELKRTTAFKNVDPETELRTALAEYKTRTQRRIEELQDKIANKDFAPKKAKSPIRLDEEALKLEAEKKRLQGDYEREVEKNRLADRGYVNKAQDTFVKYRRGFILSALSIIEKLGAAAGLRLASTHLEERVGGALSKFPGFSKIAERAPREGGYNSQAESKAISDVWQKTISEAGKKLKTGQDTLDTLYGPVNKIPQEWIDYFGNFHGALKTPAKIAEFGRAYQKRMAFAIRNGEDSSDPFTQMKVGTEAYKDSKRAIFMQDNRLVSAYSLGLNRLAQVDKRTGKVPASGKILHTIFNTELPIVKIPTNLVAEGIEYGLGSITGSARAAMALAKGVETLKPDEADMIMRELKKGSIGAAGLLIGFLGASTLNGFIQAGGFYEPGSRDKKGAPKEGELKVAGEIISKNLLHAPIMETIQMGANMRKVADMEFKKGKLPLTAYGYGLYRTVIGLIEQTAFLGQAAQVAKALDPRQDTSFWGELAKSLAIPSLVSGIATKGINVNGHVLYAGDTDAAGNVIKRQTKSIPDYIKSGIPGLRETLPRKK